MVIWGFGGVQVERFGVMGVLGSGFWGSGFWGFAIIMLVYESILIEILRTHILFFIYEGHFKDGYKKNVPQNFVRHRLLIQNFTVSRYYSHLC